MLPRYPAPQVDRIGKESCVEVCTEKSAVLQAVHAHASLHTALRPTLRNLELDDDVAPPDPPAAPDEPGDDPAAGEARHAPAPALERRSWTARGSVGGADLEREGGGAEGSLTSQE